MIQLIQTPQPDKRMIFFRGDIVTFSLELKDTAIGRAWLRTNIGRGQIQHDEIIRYAEKGLPPLSQDWHDLPMKDLGAGVYRIDLPLLEVGRFEAKAFFVSKQDSVILWPSGGNTILKVEPAESASSNTMYTAFVRQFCPDKGIKDPDAPYDTAIRKLDEAGYEVIPRSGKFRELIGELDFITKILRCRIVQLLPIFPTPTTYARMGRFGSPFAAMDLFDVDPALAEFDKQTTPLQQFQELVDEVHNRNARIFLDIPVNHTGWASSLQIHHPEWFCRNTDDMFISPGAWGIVWGDLSELDYRHRELWKYIAEVFLFWCRKGVDGFRLDAGYKIPFAVWRYITAYVRNQYPDTIFMLEGLGGDPAVTEQLLADSGINWAYSELFQNYSREQVEYYLPRAHKVSLTKGTLIHFSETHDNNRLASESALFARLRCSLCALASDNGAFGFTNGVEWYADEKISVHKNSSLNWGSEENMVSLLSRLNEILEFHPAFFPGASIKTVHTGIHKGVVFLRTDCHGENPLLILANLDTHNECTLSWERLHFRPSVDLLSGKKISVMKISDIEQLKLLPGEVMALTADMTWLDILEEQTNTMPDYERNRQQVLRAKALEIYQAVHSNRLSISNDVDIDLLIKRLVEDPTGFVHDCTPYSAPRTTVWRWQKDLTRTTAIPPQHFLCIISAHPFFAEIDRDNAATRFERSICRIDGIHFVLTAPFATPPKHEFLTLKMTVFEPSEVKHAQARLLLLSEGSDAKVYCTHTIEGVEAPDRSAVVANNIGTMSQVRMAWGNLHSKYDALLAANLNKSCPSDRRVMLTRIRAWLICRGYSFALNIDSQKRFTLDGDGSVVWRFSVPGGQGLLVAVKIVLRMDPLRNRIFLDIHRLSQDDRPYRRPDNVPVELILRPDIEDRVSHEVTKAYTGPEHMWPKQIVSYGDGFSFSPSNNRHLHIFTGKGVYIDEKEWKYQVYHSEDFERGMDPWGDLFSPGYFRIPLLGGQSVCIQAAVSDSDKRPKSVPMPGPIPSKQFQMLSVKEAARRAISAFIVNRDNCKTVIAGYPWFLDWGRDTLIALRGIISAGKLKESREILMQFAEFERNGTLPNMIRGEDHSNRDTSDAPLWFFVAVSDLIKKEGNDSFLNARAGERTVREVLYSIVQGYINGAENGIYVDSSSGMVFSPSHFTWMDTNYPAGTPREGYPVEIQALFINALRVAAQIFPGKGFDKLAAKAQQSFHNLFIVQNGGERYLSDCLRATPGMPASAAIQDDALRPNQLLAICLEIVTDKNLCRAILSACEELLVPGGIRSLANRPVCCELEIRHSGKLLNNPSHPYSGHYSGDEDTSRKPAYHNGTAWTWLFPSYCEAMYMTYGDSAKKAALSILSSASVPMNQGVLLHVPEIMDGDTPHTPKGCGAQAWGASELYRVWKKIE